MTWNFDEGEKRSGMPRLRFREDCETIRSPDFDVIMSVDAVVAEHRFLQKKH